MPYKPAYFEASDTILAIHGTVPCAATPAGPACGIMLHPRHGEAVELKRGTVLFIVLWLLVQLATPAILLVKSGGGVSPFGWQMFADIPTLPEYWVERTDSSRVKFDMARKAPRARREIDYRSVVPAYVCSSDSTVVAVYLVSPEREERFPCR